MFNKGRAVVLLARRFLVSKESDGFLSMITWVSVLGVSLGVLALVVVTSVINGFQGELTRVITGMNGEVVLYSRGEPVADGLLVEEKIRKAVPEAQAITQSLVAELMVAGPNAVSGAFLEGIDLSTVGQVTELPKRLVSGRLPEAAGEVTLGVSLAERIGAREGTEIRLIAPFAGDAPAAENDKHASGTPKVTTAKVVGTVRMGMHDYDSKLAFASLKSAQDLLGQDGKVSSFKIRLARGVDSRKISDRLTDIFGYPFRAKDWGQQNKNLFYAIELEKVVIAIILTIIVVVAAFNVVSTLMMMIYDKTREIAILKAIGFRPGQSFGLFCLIGMGIGTVGTILGVLLGLALNWVLQRTKLIDLPADVYYIGFLPVKVNWPEVAWIGGVSLLITLLATLYPAYKVSTRSPLDGIRYD